MNADRVSNIPSGYMSPVAQSHVVPVVIQQNPTSTANISNGQPIYGSRVISQQVVGAPIVANQASIVQPYRYAVQGTVPQTTVVRAVQPAPQTVQVVPQTVISQPIRQQVVVQ